MRKEVSEWDFSALYHCLLHLACLDKKDENILRLKKGFDGMARQLRNGASHDFPPVHKKYLAIETRNRTFCMGIYSVLETLWKVGVDAWKVLLDAEGATSLDYHHLHPFYSITNTLNLDGAVVETLSHAFPRLQESFQL